MTREQAQRLAALIHAKRPMCPISILRQLDGSDLLVRVTNPYSGEVLSVRTEAEYAYWMMTFAKAPVSF